MNKMIIPIEYNDKTFKFKTSSELTIGQLKHKIYKLMGIKETAQNLLLNNKILMDNEILSDYNNIFNNSIIKLTINSNNSSQNKIITQDKSNSLANISNSPYEDNKDKDYIDPEYKVKALKETINCYDISIYFNGLDIFLNISNKEDIMLGILKKHIKHITHIPLHRQILLFDEKEYSDNAYLSSIKSEYFQFKINNIRLKNDYVNIEVIDYRKYSNNNTGNFELKVDLYSNILKQISQYKKISSYNLYLIYADIFFNYQYNIFADNHLGKKIKVELYDINYENNKLIINVKTVTGKTISIGANSSLPIALLKKLIQDKEGIPPAQQKLVFEEKQLEDCRTLASYNIQSGAIINLIFRFRGEK